jgi:hypothetical protein
MNRKIQRLAGGGKWGSLGLKGSIESLEAPWQCASSESNDAKARVPMPFNDWRSISRRDKLVERAIGKSALIELVLIAQST